MKSLVMRTFGGLGLVLVLLVAGCGSDDDSSEGSSESVELPAEAVDALAAYTEATAVDHDGDAMLVTVTDDYTFLSVGETVKDKDAYADEVNLYSSDYVIETIGDDEVVGGGDTYIVSRANDASGGGFFSTGFSVIRLVETEDGWLVDAHRFLGDRSAAQ
ncbi:MAG: hypothetical protein ACR2OH_00840 [Microthrixaceae bacterium]